jgi:hypothetical protein
LQSTVYLGFLSFFMLSSKIDLISSFNFSMLSDGDLSVNISISLEYCSTCAVKKSFSSFV